MAKYKRVVKFQYYQVKSINVATENPEYKIFNFAKWIKAIEENNLIKVAIDFGNAKARIETCVYSKNNGTWGIRILKLRDTNIPTKAKDKVAAEVIELEDGEYIGEDVFITYNPINGIAMIQQNRLSLGISRIEEFFEETYNKYVIRSNKVSISIQPILDLNGKQKIKRSDFKCLEIGFANMNQFVENDERKALGTLMNPLKNMYGVNGTIKISLGRTGFDTLNKKEIRDLVKEIGEPSNKRYIRTARLRIKEEDDTDVEIIDLFNDVCTEFIEFIIDSSKGLVFTATVSAMNERYQNRKEELEKLIKYK